MPKVAVPATLAGMSSRGGGLPISLNSDGFLSGGGGMAEVVDEIDQLAERRDLRAIASADLAVDHDELADGNRRLAHGGPQQQLARHGASHAHRQPSIARRGRAAGRRDAQHAAQLLRRPVRDIDDGAGLLRRERQAVDQDIDVAIDAVLGRILDADLVPACVHLLGDQHGERGIDALPHLGARHGHDHRVVARDLHPAVEARLTRLDVEQGASAQPVAPMREPPADTDEAGAQHAADDRLAPGEQFTTHRPGSPPRDARPDGLRCRCRSGRCWSGRRRFPDRSAWASPSEAPPSP